MDHLEEEKLIEKLWDFYQNEKVMLTHFRKVYKLCSGLCSC